MLDQIIKSSIFDLNLAEFKYRYGRKIYEELISDIVTIKTITEIQNQFFSPDRKDILNELLDKYCLGHTAYYNYLRAFHHVGLSALIRDSRYAPRSICPLAEDYICNSIFNKIDTNQSMLYEDLLQLSEKLVKMLGVKVRHAKPYSPWTKPIERSFRTIANRFLRRVPGNGGSKRRSQYTDLIEAEKKPELSISFCK